MWKIANCLLVFVTLAAADETFYQPVEGKCSDVHPVQDYSAQRAATGRWYNQYVSYGKEGDSCASSHAVKRGTTIYLDFFVYDKQDKEYVRINDDLTYHTERPGIYINSKGVTLYILGCDLLSYIYLIQCLDEVPTKVTAVFATREPEMSKKDEEVYKNITARLEKMKLLPKMHNINHKNCPPTYLIHSEKPT